MKKDWVMGLPKLDLHVHLDGSLRLETVKDLAEGLPAEERVSLPIDLARSVTPPLHCTLEEYLRAFEVTVALLQTAEALERAAYELCEDAARENVVYIEIRYAPLLHLRAGLSPREAVVAVLSGMQRAEKDLGIKTGLILCALKHESTERSMEAAQLAAQYVGKGVVGFDLAGPERGFPPRLHREAIEMTRDAGVHVTLHAGEGCCPEHIREALDLGAERIGHGVYLYQDEATERRVAEEGIPLEVCPTSNLQISGFMRTLADHPLKRYLDRGIRVTVNTDNRLMSRTTSTDELFRLIEAFGLGREEVRRLLLYSAEAAFLGEEERRALRGRVEEAFAGAGG
jgi:adenosine deaminase